MISKLIKLKQKPPTRPGLKLLAREKAESLNLMVTKKNEQKIHNVRQKYSLMD